METVMRMQAIKNRVTMNFQTHLFMEGANFGFLEKKISVSVVVEFFLYIFESRSEHMNQISLVFTKSLP